MFKIIGVVTEAIRVTDELTDKLQNHVIIEMEGEVQKDGAVIGRTRDSFSIEMDERSSPQVVIHYGHRDADAKAHAGIVALAGKRLDMIGKRFELSIEE